MRIKNSTGVLAGGSIGIILSEKDLSDKAREELKAHQQWATKRYGNIVPVYWKVAP